MTRHQPHTDRPQAEDLLGESRMTRAEQAALSELLTSVSAPAHPGELRGEAQALAAFRAAFPPVASTVGSGSTMKARLARALSIKAALAALTVVGMGGVAVAASTGTLPGPIDGPRNKPATVQPATVEPKQVDLVAPAAGPSGQTAPGGAPALVAPGRAVSESTKGAEQRALVRERNAQRQQEQRDALRAEREERLARQEQQRQKQAARQRELMETQAERKAQPQPQPQPQTTPKNERESPRLTDRLLGNR